MTDRPGDGEGQRDLPPHPSHLPAPGSTDLLHLAGCQTRGDLLTALATEVLTYTPADLVAMRGVMEREIRHVPAYYRERLRPMLTEQVFGAHHRLLLMHRSGMAKAMTQHLPDTFPEYCRVAHGNLISTRDGSTIRIDALYFLLGAFTIFVLEEPGHPVGTPFPGGFTVKQRDGKFYCPVREKEEDVPNAICRFCPAVQTPGV